MINHSKLNQQFHNMMKLSSLVLHNMQIVMKLSSIASIIAECLVSCKYQSSLAQHCEINKLVASKHGEMRLV